MDTLPATERHTAEYAELDLLPTRAAVESIDAGDATVAEAVARAADDRDAGSGDLRAVAVGPEAIAGSARMKAGTARRALETT